MQDGWDYLDKRMRMRALQGASDTGPPRYEPQKAAPCFEVKLLLKYQLCVVAGSSTEKRGTVNRISRDPLLARLGDFFAVRLAMLSVPLPSPAEKIWRP